jgi:hypothetical protein
MKLYDAHTHIGMDYFYYKIKGYRKFNFHLKDLSNSMENNNVSKSIVSLCPSIKEITCCSPTNLVKKNKDLLNIFSKLSKSFLFKFSLVKTEEGIL